MTITEIEQVLEGVNIRSKKKKALIARLQKEQKHKDFVKREIGYLLPNFFSDTRNTFNP